MTDKNNKQKRILTEEEANELRDAFRETLRRHYFQLHAFDENDWPIPVREQPQ